MPLLLLVALLSALLFSWWAPPLYPYNFQRWMMLALLMGVLGMAGWIQRHRVRAVIGCGLSRSATWPLTLAMLLVVAGLVVSPLPAVALLELCWWLALAGMALLIGLSAARMGPLAWQLFGAMAALLLLVYALIALDSIHFHWPIFTRLDATPGLTQIRQFSDLAVGLMPLGLVYVVARRRLSLAVALLTALPLAVWWYVLFLTEARSGVLSLTMAMLVAVVLFRRRSVWPVGTLFLSALSALAAWWWLNPLRKAVPLSTVAPYGNVESSSTAASAGGDGGIFTRDVTFTHDRLVVWKEAYQHAIDHFPLGVGPMGYAGDGIQEDFFRNFGHAHNLFLNTAAEWGILLAMLLLSLVLYGCWRILQRIRSLPDADQPLYSCLVMAFVGVMVNVQFAGAHIIPLSSLVMVMSIGLVFGFRGLAEAPTTGSAQPRRFGSGPTMLWAAGMLVTAYLLLAGWELYGISVESSRPCFEELGRTWYVPRFWAQGRLECMQIVAPDHWLFWHWR